MFTNTLSESANKVADQVELSADHALASTQRVANDALERLSDAMHDTTRRLRDTTRIAGEGMVRTIRDDPVTSVLIAVAAGAALMALAGWLTAGRNRR